MDCSSCKDRRADPVPFIVHESAMARAERTIKRLWIIAIILILLLAGTNGAWIYYESQWEVVETTEVSQESDGNGTNNYVGGNVYGTADSQDNEETGS